MFTLHKEEASLLDRLPYQRKLLHMFLCTFVSLLFIINVWQIAHL